ncbi:single-stranded DNA-binding protein [Atopobacter sp. AH10]|uniref:single-stranded DNA-binding protein n=1 Tax=Atopobacter sp. AH10 TaxID=2315861 RepID=UPI000EF2242D|nr:single-stranded DNA-binding protein [Atopobacter sp. AH10]RLK62824.1 single-stranded DNA-binding protein [Atopobacter sp. AH10]
MINNVVLVGRLTREVDLRFTGNSTAVGTFSLAVDRSFQNRNGERETDFINCVIWRKSAENFANFTRKGSLVGIEGRLQTRNYENQQGQRVYVTEVIVDRFSLLEPRSVTEQRPVGDSRQSSGQYKNNYQSSMGGNNNGYQGTNHAPIDRQPSEPSFSDPFADDGMIDISNDDLPF